MKKHGRSAVLIAICAGALCAAAQAQPQPVNNSGTTTTTTTTTVVTPPSTYYSPMTRFYAGIDAGGVLTGNSEVKEFFGPVAPNTKVQFDPGVRVGLKGGYQLTDWLSAEGETGVMANNIKSISGATLDGNVTFANVPFLVNARLTLPGHCLIKPYIGGGVGGSSSVISIEHHVDLNGVSVSGSDATVVFAYQAFGGLRYAISDNMGVGVEYHYFATTGADWKTDSAGTASDHLQFRGVQSHVISLAFDYRF